MAVLGFPDEVDEVSARLVAGAVTTTALVAAVTGQLWLLVPLTYGFWARVLTGPKLSPLGLAVTRVVRPRLGAAPRPVAGAPKRFAQGIGAGVTTVASVLALTGAGAAARTLLAVLVVAAGLESVLGLCLGCKAYGWLARVGVVREPACESCVLDPAGAC